MVYNITWFHHNFLSKNGLKGHNNNVYWFTMSLFFLTYNFLTYFQIKFYIPNLISSNYTSHNNIWKKWCNKSIFNNIMIPFLKKLLNNDVI